MTAAPSFLPSTLAREIALAAAAAVLEQRDSLQRVQPVLQKEFDPGHAPRVPAHDQMHTERNSGIVSSIRIRARLQEVTQDTDLGFVLDREEEWCPTFLVAEVGLSPMSKSDFDIFRQIILRRTNGEQ